EHDEQAVRVSWARTHRGGSARSDAPQEIRPPRELHAGDASRGPGGGRIREAGEALSEAAAVAGFGGAGFPLSHRDRPSAAPAVGGGSGSANPATAAASDNATPASLIRPPPGPRDASPA